VKRREAAFLITGLNLNCCMMNAEAMFQFVRGLCQELVAIGWLFRPVLSVAFHEGDRGCALGFGPNHAGIYHAEKTDPQGGTTIYNVDYAIDENLVRPTLSSKTGPTVVFFGNSFTFGVGVNDPDTLPQLFADVCERKLRVLNLAIGAYGPQHFLRELQTGLHDSLIGPQPALFLFFTAAWHAERNACRPDWMLDSPRYAIEGGQIVFEGACYEGISRQVQIWLQDTTFYRVFIEPYRNRIFRANDVELYIKTLLAAVGLAKEKYGVRTLAPYIRVAGYLRGTVFSDDDIIKRLKQGGAIVIDASLAKEEREGAIINIPGDGHPTPLANLLRGAMLKDCLKQISREILASGSN
jgi:hypothetical protein